MPPPPTAPLRRFLLAASFGTALLPLHAYSRPQQKIGIVIGANTILVTLDDNASARDFAALLPLSLTLEDYAATEKVATLPRKLSIAGAPAGMTPAVGDVCYYAPWGNLAIFHKPFAYSAGLVRLGRVDAGIDVLRAEGRMAARIEAVPRQAQ